MKTQVKRWGNSLAFRIPQSIGQQLGIVDGTPLELEVRADGVLLKPAKLKRSRYSITDLLEGVSPKAIQPLDDDPPTGLEVW
jgi:antitoxin component of MazEF toxin-antitoxin module